MSFETFYGEPRVSDAPTPASSPGHVSVSVSNDAVLRVAADLLNRYPETGQEFGFVERRLLLALVRALVAGTFKPEAALYELQEALERAWVAGRVASGQPAPDLSEQANPTCRAEPWEEILEMARAEVGDHRHRVTLKSPSESMRLRSLEVNAEALGRWAEYLILRSELEVNHWRELALRFERELAER
jgi:hypothetical protein